MVKNLYLCIYKENWLMYIIYILSMLKIFNILFKKILFLKFIVFFFLLLIFEVLYLFVNFICIIFFLNSLYKINWEFEDYYN